MRIVNFVHGDMLMLAMYMAYWMFKWFSIDNYVGLLVIIPVVAALGALIYWGILRFALRRSHEASILATIGVSIILQNAALILWSADYRSIHNELSTMSIELAGDTPVRSAPHRLRRSTSGYGPVIRFSKPHLLG